MEKLTQPNKYLVLLTVTLGTMLSGYVSSSVNIALPNIMQVFGFSMDSVIWVSLSYMIPYGSILPITGKLGDQFGRKRIYLTGLAVFTLATLLVGLAWNSAALICFRVLQGTGAGLLFPNAMALVSEAFPPQERGKALGMWGALGAAGGSLGPTIGGSIVEYLDWHLIFYSILPLAAAGLLLGTRTLQESKAVTKAEKIDFIGGALLVTSISCLLLVLNQGSKEGWTSTYILGMSALAVLAIAGFIYVESHIAAPMVDLGLFLNSSFTMSNIVGFLSFMAMYGGLYLLPFYLRNIQGFTAIHAGICMLPLSLSMVLLAPLGGRLADRFGARMPAAAGMTIMALALYSFRVLDDKTGYAYIAAGLVVMGVGLALTMSPLSNGVMGSLPKDKLGVGSGVFNLFKNIGGSVGVAVMGTLLDSRTTFHTIIYTNYLNGGSAVAGQTQSLLTAGFMQSGFPAATAKTMALAVLQGLVAKQAAILSFEDVFLITALLCATAIIPALLIRDGDKRRTRPAPAEAAGETATSPA